MSEDYRKPILDWETIAKTMFTDRTTPESHAHSLKNDYLEAAKIMNSGITPESWRDIPCGIQKRIRAIADYRKENGGGYYEAAGRSIEYRGTAKFVSSR